MPSPLPFVQVRAEFRSGISASRLARGLFTHQSAGSVSAQALAKWAGIGLAVECWAWAQAACPSGRMETPDAAELLADAVGWPSSPEALLALLEGAHVVEVLPVGFRLRGWEELYGKALERRDNRAEFRKAAEYLRRRGYRNSGKGDNSMTSPTGEHIDALGIVRIAAEMRGEAASAPKPPRGNARQTAGKGPSSRQTTPPLPASTPARPESITDVPAPSSPPVLTLAPPPVQAPMFGDNTEMPKPKAKRAPKPSAVQAQAPRTPAPSMQQRIYEGLERRRSERCAEAGVPYSHGALPPQQVNVRLKHWAGFEKGTPEFDKYVDAWGLYLEDMRHASKGWPIGLFLSEGVLRDYLARVDEEDRRIQALPTLSGATVRA